MMGPAIVPSPARCVVYSRRSPVSRDSTFAYIRYENKCDRWELESSLSHTMQIFARPVHWCTR